MITRNIEGSGITHPTPCPNCGGTLVTVRYGDIPNTSVGYSEERCRNCGAEFTEEYPGDGTLYPAGEDT
jgi:hypothetical protein